MSKEKISELEHELQSFLDPEFSNQLNNFLASLDEEITLGYFKIKINDSLFTFVVYNIKFSCKFSEHLKH